MKKFILTALSTAILTACGGGGDDTQSVPQDVKKNNAPSVDIIAEKNYQEQTVVNLQAKASDSDNDELSYSWTKQSGPELNIENNTASTLTFTAPILTEEAVFTFEVKVDDNKGGEAKSTHTLTISPVNDTPKTEAGENQTINEQLLVTLKGSASDKDGEITKIEWLQTSGSKVDITKVSDTEATFVAPTVTKVETLIFELSATDNESASSKDSVIITVNPVNVAPVAEAGTKQTINPGVKASLDASQSTDEDGELVSYQWVQTQGSSIELKHANSLEPNFTPLNSQEGETLTFELTVTDNEGSIDKDTIQTYINKHPVANAGKDKVIETGYKTTLDASLSQDDGQIISYNWTQIKGETITLINADTSTPSFTADFADDKVITIQVTVTDDMGLSHSDDVEITVVKINRFLNDTGITVSADFSDGNDTQCNASSTNNHDCEQGRDALAIAGTLAKTGAGIAGFDFTKLAEDGSVLSEDAAQWSCVRDNHTGLIWEVKKTDGGIQDRIDSYRWGGAGAFGANDANRQGTYYNEWNELVNHLNTNSICGKSDWALPSVEELTSIRTHQKNGDQLDTQFFPNNVNGLYWTATPSAYSSDRAHFVNFRDSDDGILVRSAKNRVRLVSGGGVNQEAYLVNDHSNERYVLLENGTATDLETGLMWSRCFVGQTWDQNTLTCVGDSSTLNWQQAHEAGSTSTLGDHTNWRLPNIKELRSIAAFDKTSPAFNTQIFPNMQFSSIDRIWSATPAIAGYNAIYALTLTSAADVDAMRRATTTPRVLLVRNLR